MKKLLSIMAVTLMAGLVIAATGFAGRKVFAMTVAGDAVQTDTASALKVTAVNVRYGSPATLTLYFYTTLSGVKVLRYQTELTAASSVVYVPEGLWLKKADVLTVSNSV